MKSIFIGVYSQGYPFDSGIKMQDVSCANKILLKKFDIVDIKSINNLCKNDSIYINLTKDYTYLTKTYPEYIKFNELWAKVGFLMWKPRFIYDSLNKYAKEGDIVVYHDLNFIKYPSYINNFNNIEKLFKKYLSNNFDIILTRDTVKPLSEDVKSYLIEKINGNNFYFNKNLPGFWAGACAFKKNKSSLIFLKEWITVTENLNNVSPFPDFDSKKINKDFCWHAQEQSTLAVHYHNLELKNKKKIKILYAPNRSFNDISIKYFYSYLNYKFNLIKLFFKRLNLYNE